MRVESASRDVEPVEISKPAYLGDVVVVVVVVESEINHLLWTGQDSPGSPLSQFEPL
jgi:hypothetical protein